MHCLEESDIDQSDFFDFSAVFSRQSYLNLMVMEMLTTTMASVLRAVSPHAVCSVAALDAITFASNLVWAGSEAVLYQLSALHYFSLLGQFSQNSI